MTTHENTLALQIVQEEFGDVAKSVVEVIIKKNHCSFTFIQKETRFSNQLTAQILSVLIAHRLISYNFNGRQYCFNTKNTISRLKHSQYIYITKVLFGYISELIIEEVLLNGILKQKEIESKVKQRIDTLSSNIEFNTESFLESFNKLVHNNCLKKFSDLSNNDQKNETLKRKGYDDEVNIGRSTEEKYSEDNFVYWCIDYFKLDTILRDRLIQNVFENKIDKVASSIVKTILSFPNEESGVQFRTKPITSIDIQKLMKNEYQIDNNVVEKYLNIITQDSFSCVEKIGDYGNGAYIIDFKKTFDYLCKAHLESFVKEKYGSKSLRIFKVIIDKVQLEQKQIEELAMIPSKECKELLYNMLNDNILGITELSKTADHAPSRTFYMLKVNQYENIKKLYDYSYKAIFNLKIRHQLEIRENRRLIEKQQKLDSIIETLKIEGADETEIEEYKDYMNSNEVKQIQHIHNVCNKNSMEHKSLCDYIYKIGKPVVFKNILKSEGTFNSAADWNPKILSEILKGQIFVFRIGKKNNANLQYENECDYTEASLSQFIEWYESKAVDEKNPFFKYKKEEYWVYCDYKYMSELFEGKLKNCINWHQFGFNQRDSKDSTFWLGTENAYTPCHYDTYGYNLVAQIYGSKRWIIFPDSDVQYLSPTRIPFEESTIYTEINIKSPNLKKFTAFKNASPFVVELNAGDVLYVPKRFWHFVECLDLSISINTWVELEEDNIQRLKESITKTLLQSLMTLNFQPFESWLNETESFTTHEENLGMIQNCIDDIVSKNKNTISVENFSEEFYKNLLENHSNFAGYVNQLSFDDYLKIYTTPTSDQAADQNEIRKDLTMCLAKCVTNPKVVDLISSLLLSK